MLMSIYQLLSKLKAPRVSAILKIYIISNISSFVEFETWKAEMEEKEGCSFVKVTGGSV